MLGYEDSDSLDAGVVDVEKEEEEGEEREEEMRRVRRRLEEEGAARPESAPPPLSPQVRIGNGILVTESWISSTVRIGFLQL